MIALRFKPVAGAVFIGSGVLGASLLSKRWDVHTAYMFGFLWCSLWSFLTSIRVER